MPTSTHALGDDEFWRYVEVLDGAVDETALDALTEALRAGGAEACVGFAERLAAVLHDLDRRVLAEQPVRWADDPDGVVIPLSADTFLYLRAAVVARGRDAVARVLADPTVLGREIWDDGEGLLYVAEDALGDEIETVLSYETGSNVQQWPSAEDGPAPLRATVALVVLDPSATPPGLADDPALAELLAALPSTALPLETILAAAGPVDELLVRSGGLPASLGAESVHVEVTLGGGWQLGPLVGQAAPEAFGHATVVAVQVGADRDSLISWPPARQLQTLRALTALGVLALLPEDHAAHAHLRALVDAGALGAGPA